MLADGDRGVVLQRDRQTYAIAPHLPCGLVTPAMLRKLADVAEKYDVQAVKCTSAERIALVGVREEDVDRIWAEFGESPSRGHMTGRCIRSVRACPGTQFCKRGRQDSLALGLELDRRYHGKALPGKMKLGVSGCGNQCAETGVRDIGLVGTPVGWTVMVGGMAGSCPRLGQLFAEDLRAEEALALVDRLIAYFAAHARPGERLGEVIDRLTFKEFRAQVEACNPA
jgi:NAD(P)H-nitrite reductase large subunit